MGWSNQQQFILDSSLQVAASTAAAKSLARLLSPGRSNRTVFSPAVVSKAVRDEMLDRHGAVVEPPVPVVADVLAAEKGALYDFLFIGFIYSYMQPQETRYLQMSYLL